MECRALKKELLVVDNEANVLCGAPTIACVPRQKLRERRALPIRQFGTLGHSGLPIKIDQESSRSST
jgi:hypothetical protein